MKIVSATTKATRAPSKDQASRVWFLARGGDVASRTAPPNFALSFQAHALVQKLFEARLTDSAFHQRVDLGESARHLV